MEQDVQRESPVPWQRVKRRRTNTGENLDLSQQESVGIQQKNRFAVFANTDQNENTSSGNESSNKTLGIPTPPPIYIYMMFLILTIW